MTTPRFNKRGECYYLDAMGHRIRPGMVLEFYPRIDWQPDDLIVVSCFDTMNVVPDLGAQKDGYINSLSEYDMGRWRIKDYETKWRGTRRKKEKEMIT